MRGVVFRGDRKLEIMNFPDPVPGPGEAVIEMKASGMCGSDLHFYRHNPADSLGLPELVVHDVFRDRQGTIWAVTENFLVRLVDAERGRFEKWRFKERPTAGQWIFPSTMQDAQGALHAPQDFMPTQASQHPGPQQATPMGHQTAQQLGVHFSQLPVAVGPRPALVQTQQ